jgi:hypothetical protein
MLKLFQRAPHHEIRVAHTEQCFWSNGVGGRRAQRQEWLVPARSPHTLSLPLVTRPAVLASSPLACTHSRWGLEAGLASRGLILEHSWPSPPGPPAAAPCCARCVGWPQSANGMPGMPRSVRVIALAVFIALCLCSRMVRRVWATARLSFLVCTDASSVARVGQ